MRTASIAARLALSGGDDTSLRLWTLHGDKQTDHVALVIPNTTDELTEKAAKVHQAICNAQANLEKDDADEALIEIFMAREIPGYGKNRELMDLWNKIGKPE